MAHAPQRLSHDTGHGPPAPRASTFTRRRLLRAGAAAIGAASVATACSRGPERIRIGIAQPQSGPSAPRGQDLTRGAQLAIDQINARQPRIDEHPVRFEAVVRDDESDTAVAERVAHELVTQQVAAVVGHLNSNATIAAAPIYGAAGIPQLSTSTQPGYTEFGLPGAFRLVASDRLQCRALASHAASQSPGAIAVLDDGSVYGVGLADMSLRALQALGRAVPVRRSFDTRTLDFQAIVRDLVAAQVRVPVCMMSDLQVAALADQLAEVGLHDVRLVGSQTVKTRRLLDRPKPLPFPLSVTSPLLEPLEFHGGRRFVDDFQAAFGQAPVYAAHYAYDAVFMVYAAMRLAGSSDPRGLARALRQLDLVAPVNTTLKFGPDGEPLYGSIAIYRLTQARWELLANSDRW